MKIETACLRGGCRRPARKNGLCEEHYQEEKVRPRAERRAEARARRESLRANRRGVERLISKTAAAMNEGYSDDAAIEEGGRRITESAIRAKIPSGEPVVAHGTLRQILSQGVYPVYLAVTPERIVWALLGAPNSSHEMLLRTVLEVEESDDGLLFTFERDGSRLYLSFEFDHRKNLAAAQVRGAILAMLKRGWGE